MMERATRSRAVWSSWLTAEMKMTGRVLMLGESGGVVVRRQGGNAAGLFENAAGGRGGVAECWVCFPDLMAKTQGRLAEARLTLGCTPQPRWGWCVAEVLELGGAKCGKMTLVLQTAARSGCFTFWGGRRGQNRSYRAERTYGMDGQFVGAKGEVDGID